MRTGNGPRVLGHRGARGHAPENTLKGFRLGVALGADWVECDVHLTRDGQVVVIHDDTVDRTTTGSGAVRDLTLAQIRQLDAGDGERVPTLEALLDWAKPLAPLGVAIEIKSENSAASSLAAAVVRVVNAHAMVERVMVISFDTAAIREVKALAPEIRTGWLFADPQAQVIQAAQQLGASAIWPQLRLVTRDLVDRCHQQGVAVWTWLANSSEDIEQALSAGVDGMGSDFPERVRTAIAAWDKPTP